MYKFFGEPLKEIKSKATGKVVFRFDTKGEFSTDDGEIIKRALGFFDYIKLETSKIGERTKKTFIVPAMTITNKDEKETKEEETKDEKEITDIKTYKCKKCDFETDNKGLLMSHHREAHKKEV